MKYTKWDDILTDENLEKFKVTFKKFINDWETNLMYFNEEHYGYIPSDWIETTTISDPIRRYTFTISTNPSDDSF